MQLTVNLNDFRKYIFLFPNIYIKEKNILFSKSAQTVLFGLVVNHTLCFIFSPLIFVHLKTATEKESE